MEVCTIEYKPLHEKELRDIHQLIMDNHENQITIFSIHGCLTGALLYPYYPCNYDEFLEFISNNPDALEKENKNLLDNTFQFISNTDRELCNTKKIYPLVDFNISTSWDPHSFNEEQRAHLIDWCQGFLSFFETVKLKYTEIAEQLVFIYYLIDYGNITFDGLFNYCNERALNTYVTEQERNNFFSKMANQIPLMINEINEISVNIVKRLRSEIDSKFSMNGN